MNTIFSQELVDLIGEDYNPLGWKAEDRIRLEGRMLLDCFKEYAYSLLAAREEGISYEDIIRMINPRDLEFIYMLDPNMDNKSIFDSEDLVVAAETQKLQATLGEEYNPFNWDARTRIPLAISQLVGCIKSIIHIIIQGDSEGLTPQDLFEEINEDVIQVLDKVA